MNWFCRKLRQTTKCGSLAGFAGVFFGEALHFSVKQLTALILSRHAVDAAP